ncbi:uncharacterized protein K441DRAFT_663592 [Cenococcum geophilum 1.58]|uniref:uncharacterized protein n=1 Tax=Cenococcum geophilum 1.58 TaxID=794803 RepID=UPI00358EEB01|nr:hypothetical protein K441DRAFT_663592 [Cenococcum geophilum 1.58]
MGNIPYGVGGTPSSAIPINPPVSPFILRPSKLSSLAKLTMLFLLFFVPFAARLPLTFTLLFPITSSPALSCLPLPFPILPRTIILSGLSLSADNVPNLRCLPTAASNPAVTPK